MTAKEAFQLFASTHDISNLKIRGCMEYASCFVFEAVPLSLKDEKLVYDCLYEVNKKDGKQKIFMPINITPAEYNAGRAVKPYEYLL